MIGQSRGNPNAEQQYRICKLRVPTSLLDRGFEIPPNIQRKYMVPDETEEGTVIQEIESQIDGWTIVSLSPLERESSAEELVLLAIMVRPYSEALIEYYSGR